VQTWMIVMAAHKERENIFRRRYAQNGLFRLNSRCGLPGGEIDTQRELVLYPIGKIFDPLNIHRTQQPLSHFCTRAEKGNIC